LLADRRRECSYDAMLRALELYWRPRRARAGSECADVLATVHCSARIVPQVLQFVHQASDQALLEVV